MYNRTSLATACAVAFAFVALGSSPAAAISTYKSWDGAQYVYPFGCPDTTTYGQVITAPNKHTLNKFAFSWANSDGSTGSMVVRGEVYAWDGTKATGSALWESKPRTISYGDGLFHQETFKPGALPMTPGAQYVLFASIDKDYEQCGNNYELIWGLVDDSVYPGGTFVYQNNSGDENQWTLTGWSTYGGDLAFKAALSP
jgi:hypothetical protein